MPRRLRYPRRATGDELSRIFGGELVVRGERRVHDRRIYVLRRVWLDQIEIEEPWDLDLARQYAARRTPFPPIVLTEDGAVADGQHRAYVPTAQFGRA